MAGFNHFPQVAAGAQAAVDLVLDAAAARVEADSKNRAPVDKGVLKGSGGHANTGKNERTVYFTAEHAKYQEYGTIKMSAQPFLTPAVEANREWILKAIAKSTEGAS